MKHRVNQYPSFDGVVISGKKIGRTLQFPTMNIRLLRSISLDFGIYVVAVSFPQDTSTPEVFLGAMHYGPIPFFGRKEVSMEIHLLDFYRNVYEQAVHIEVLEKIRDIRTFDSLKDLKNQIAKDVDFVRSYHHNLQN